MNVKMLLIIAFLGAVIFSGLTYFRMEYMAAGFMEQITREVLAVFDQKNSIDTMNKPILSLAKQQNISLKPEDLHITWLGNSETGGFSSQTPKEDTIEVDATFQIKRGFMTREFHKSVQRPMRRYTTGSSRPQSRSSSGSSYQGFDPPRPAKDVNSFRNDVKRAARGRD